MLGRDIISKFTIHRGVGLIYHRGRSGVKTGTPGCLAVGGKINSDDTPTVIWTNKFIPDTLYVKYPLLYLLYDFSVSIRLPVEAINFEALDIPPRSRLQGQCQFCLSLVLSTSNGRCVFFPLLLFPFAARRLSSDGRIRRIPYHAWVDQIRKL